LIFTDGDPLTLWLVFVAEPAEISGIVASSRIVGATDGQRGGDQGKKEISKHREGGFKRRANKSVDTLTVKGAIGGTIHCGAGSALL
jgi:hypothetical protein